MKLKSLHIISFGGLHGKSIELKDGVNVIEGANESGKTSVAMFIKFIFYGLSSKTPKNGAPSERDRFVSSTTAQAAGFIIAEDDDGTEYKLERALILSDDAPSRERVRIINLSNGEIVTAENPGEYFFGVPEEVFTETAFVSEIGRIKPDIFGDGGKNAIENLLTSADENVDIKKAVKKLDLTRREISHKIGGGGELNELTAKKAAIMSEIDVVRGKSAEILSVSTSLDDIKRRISELEEAKENLSKTFSALDKVNVIKQREALRECEQKTAELEKSLGDLRSSPFGGDFISSLDEAEHDICSYDELCAEFDERYPQLIEAGNEETDTSEIISEAERTDASSRILLSLGVTMLICAIAGFAVSAVMFFMGKDILLIPPIVSLVLLFTSIGLFIKRHGLQRELYDLFDEWGADDIDDLSEILSDHFKAESQSGGAALELRQLEAELGTAKIKFDTATETVASLAESAEIKMSDDIYETLASLRKIADTVESREKEITSKLEYLRGRHDILSEQIRTSALSSFDTDESDKEAESYVLSLDSNEIASLKKDRDFTENALKSALKRKNMLEEKLLELGKLTYTPAELESELDGLDEKITELTLRKDALELAGKALTEAGKEMRSGVLPRIAKKASTIVAAATDSYRAMALDSSFKPSLRTDSDIISSVYFSRGTEDITYLSLRVALASEVFTDESPMLIFDESFAHIDENRTRNFLASLSENSGGGQYIVFTCRSDDGKSAKSANLNSVKL